MQLNAGPILQAFGPDAARAIEDEMRQAATRLAKRQGWCPAVAFDVLMMLGAAHFERSHVEETRRCRGCGRTNCCRAACVRAHA